MKSPKAIQAAQKIVYAKVARETVGSLKQLPRDMTRIEYHSFVNALAKKMLDAGVTPLEFKSFFFKLGLYAGIKEIPVQNLLKNFNTWSFPLILNLDYYALSQLALDMKRTFWLPTKEDLMRQAKRHPHLRFFMQQQLEKAATAAIQLVKENEDAKIEAFIECIEDAQGANEIPVFEQYGHFLLTGYSLMQRTVRDFQK